MNGRASLWLITSVLLWLLSLGLVLLLLLSLLILPLLLLLSPSSSALRLHLARSGGPNMPARRKTPLSSRTKRCSENVYVDIGLGESLQTRSRPTLQAEMNVHLPPVLIIRRVLMKSVLMWPGARSCICRCSFGQSPSPFSLRLMEPLEFHNI